MQGKKIMLFLVNGEADGIKTLEIGGPNSIALVFPRNKLREIATGIIDKRFQKFQEQPVIYFLFGQESEESLVHLAYIGQGNLTERLRRHNRREEMNFWHTTVVFTSNDESLTDAHARYLEARCIDLARKAKHPGYRLENSNNPQLPHLHPYDLPVMEEFVADIKLLLNTIGYPVLQKIEARNEADSNNPLFFCKNREGTANGTGQLTNEGFIVYQGSTARVRQAPAIADRNNRLVERLQSEKIIKKKGESYIFERDYNFTSSSTPASLILGAPVNGWVVWKTKEGKTLKQFYGPKR